MIQKTIEKGIFLIWIWLGNIISFFKKRKKISIKNVHTIIFNRSDRIGDAIITRPFLELFKNFIKQYNAHVEIEILSSALNYSILKDIKWCKVIIKKHILKDSGWICKEILNQIKNLFTMIFTSWSQLKRTTDKIFIDLIWDVDMAREYFSLWCACLWANLYLNNFLLRYALPYHYRWPVIKNLIDCYIDLIEGGFDFHWAFRSYVYDNIQAFYDIDERIPKKNIMIFVGNKKFKNLSISTWTVLVHHLSKHFPDQTICVIDDDTNNLYDELRQEKFTWNVQLIKNTFSLDQFRKFSSTFKFILWTDGWWMNFIRNMTNTLIIYSGWPENYKVWSWFVWSDIMKWIDIKNNKIGLHIDDILNNKFWYIYKKDINDSYENHQKHLNNLILLFLKKIK